MYCPYKSTYKIRVSTIYTRSDSLGKWLIIEFSNIFQQNTFSLSKQKYHYVYGIWVGMSFFYSKSGCGQIDQDLWCLTDWLTDWLTGWLTDWLTDWLCQVSSYIYDQYQLQFHQWPWLALLLFALRNVANKILNMT